MVSEAVSQTDQVEDVLRDDGPIAEVDQARAGFYVLLARMLAEPPSQEILNQVGAIEGDDSTVGEMLRRLARLARATDAEAAEDEYTLLFYGRGDGGEVLPYASYYLTGILNDKPLADLRNEMRTLGIERGDLNKEPEDHIAFLLEMMHGLIVGSFGVGAVDLERQMAFFQRHLAPWGIDFFEDLETTKSASLYATVAGLGRVFLSLEQDAFRMAA